MSVNKTYPPFLITPFEILTDKRLTLRQIRVLMAICSWRKSNTNLARISRQMISDRTGYSLTRVTDITTSLVKIGWLKKSGNLGKKQWSEYQLQELKSGTFQNGKPHPKTGTTPHPKTGTTPHPKTGTSIDTKVLDTKVIDTEEKYTKTKKKISYSEKVKEFKPTQATADTFKSVYPLLRKPDFLEMVKQFKDQALNRGKPFIDLNAGMRNYIKRKYIEPVKQVVRENEIKTFREIGDRVRAEQRGNVKLGLPTQILINENKP